METRSSDVLVIGSGPAGMMASIIASSKRKVTLAEKPMKDFRLAKRILVSGNGRCNFFNEDLLHEDSFDDPLLSDAKAFVYDGKHDYAKETLSYLHDDLHLAYQKEGKLYYPYFNRAECVHEVLVSKIEENDIDVIQGTLDSIDPDHNACIIYENGRQVKYVYHDLVFAIGGRSYDREDYTYDLLKDLRVQYRSFQPALCPVRTVEKIPSYLSGNRIKAEVTLTIRDKIIHQERGEVIFKNDGLSGIVIFNSTLSILRNPKEEIRIHIDYSSSDPSLCHLDSYPAFLRKYIQEKQLKPGEPLIFTYQENYGFKDSQISYGGILLSELDIETMSLKKYKNIHPLGETLDLNFPCGGYNIGMALIEGYRAGKVLKGEEHD